jgi:hypothetical protein
VRTSKAKIPLMKFAAFVPAGVGRWCDICVKCRRQTSHDDASMIALATFHLLTASVEWEENKMTRSY